MKRPRPVKRILRILLLVSILLLLIAGMLPALLSSRRAQSWLRHRVNGTLGEAQHLSWDRFSLGWIGGQRIDNLVYRDKGLELTVGSISIDRGLLAMAGRQPQLGRISVDRPRVALILAPPQEAEPPLTDKGIPPVRAYERGRHPKPLEDAPVTEEKVAERPFFRMPVDVKGAVIVRNGRIHATNPAASETMSWEDIRIDADFSKGLRQPIALNFSAKQTHTAGSGNLALVLSAHFLQPDGSFDPESLFSQAALDLRSIDLGSIAWIPHEQAGAPMLNGSLDAKLVARVSGIHDLDLDLDVQLTDPVVFGGPLGEDRLEPETVAIKAKAGWRDNVLTLATLGMDNAFLNIRGSGSLEAGRDTPYPAGQMRLDLRADIARLLAQLPRTMRLHEGLVLEEGVLTADLSFDSDGASFALNGAMDIPQVRGRRNEQALTVDDFLRARIALAMSPAGPEIENISVRTGFADISGQGNPDALAVRADVDLDAARQTAGNFSDLGPQVLEGRVSIEATLDKSDAVTRVFKVMAATPGIRFGLSEDQLLSLDALSIETHGILRFDEVTGEPVRASGLRAVMRSDPVNFNLTVADVDLTAEPPAVPSANMQWDVDLGSVNAMLASAGLLTNEAAFAGRFRGAADASVKDDVLLIAPFEAGMANLRVAAQGLVFEEPSMTLYGILSMALPPAKPDLTLSNATLQSASFALHVPGLHIAVPADASPLLTLQAVLSADLDALMPLVQNAVGATIAIEGKSAATVSWQGPLDSVWEESVRKGYGAAEVRVPRVNAYGLLATNVIAAVQARDGRINLTLDTAANDGRVLIRPVIDVTGGEPWLIVPGNSHVIQDVTLTDGMASELLGLVHPLLRGSSMLGGAVNLSLETCRIPLRETGVMGADLRGIFSLRDIEFEPRGALLQILETVKLQTRSVRASEQQIAFHVADGRIHSAPLTLAIAGHELSLVGSVGLDTSLDFKILAPVSAELVGRDAYRLLAGQTLALAIGGTTLRPEIDGDAFARAIAAMARDAARAGIREEGREATRELQQRGEEALRDLLRPRR